jgi:hypothetical protein
LKKAFKRNVNSTVGGWICESNTTHLKLLPYARIRDHLRENPALLRALARRERRHKCAQIIRALEERIVV